jgi:hypothetical protein
MAVRVGVVGYGGTGVPAIFQGAEKADVAEVSFSALANYVPT